MDNPTVRNLIGIVAGVIVGGLVVFAVEAVGHSLFPPPAGTDLSNPQALEKLIGMLPIGALVAVVVGWFLGSFAGSFTAKKIAGTTVAPWAVAIVFIGLTAYNFAIIPHPMWMIAAGVLLPLLSAWLVNRGSAAQSA